MQKRYTTTGYFSTTHYEVVCPKCKKDAVVSFINKEGFYYQWHTKKNSLLVCSNCNFTEKPNTQKLYRASVNVYCPDCGTRNTVEKENLKIAPQSIDVKCSKCHSTYNYKPVNTEEEQIKEANGLQTDPIFNYPLWLQAETCGNLFWAYNHEHLEEIRFYVESDLRERNFPYLMTMVARLPTFIKTAKNRDKILACIERLKKKRL